MAKKSVIARELKRVTTVRRFRERVSALKQQARSANFDERVTALQTIQQLPRNASASRCHRRCRSCGRPRAVYRKFGLCRICLREAAMRGDIPGLVKASW